MSNKKNKLACPRCGGPVIKAGKAGSGNTRYQCRPCNFRTTQPVRPGAPTLDTSARRDELRNLSRRQRVMRYVVTAAQNATPVHDGFLAALKHYCDANDAQLVIIPYRYRNPTSQWSQDAEADDWWAPEIVPYLLDHRMDLCEHLVLLGDVRVQPTAVRPTSGLETLAGGRSAVIGHPKIELVTIPAPQYSLPKILTTTGTVTQPNYLDSKAGKKGEHHHSYGAVLIEVERERFFFRHLLGERSGAFYDLRHRYTPAGVEPAPPVAGLVLGDLHTRFVDPGVVSATFDAPDSLVNVLEPEHIVYHDILDFYSQNHHHAGKVFTQLAKYRSGQHGVEAEIDEVAAFVDARIRPGQKAVFAPSNHPDALARWIEEADWKRDPENAAFYLETALMMVRSAKMTEHGAAVDDPFVYWMERKLQCRDQAVFLARDQSYRIAGIEVGFHGDKGPNGSRGTIRGYGRVGVKSVIGHSHSPGIMDGVYQVGTSSRLKLEYNSGPSSWLHTHCCIYPNGKRTLITIIDGQWRASMKEGRKRAA